MVSYSKDNTFGAILVGFGVSCVFFGALSVQSYTYFQRYPLDRPFYRFLVVGLWLLELLHQAFVGHVTYYYLVSNWGDTTILLGRIAWTLIISVFVEVLAGAVVKACFAMRVWRFSQGNVSITAFLVILILAQIGAASVYVAKAFALASFAHVIDLRVVASISLGVAMVSDFSTAAALTYFLRHLKTGHSKDDSLVNTLIIYAINSGVFTCILSLCTLVFYDVMPENFVFLGFYFVLAKLYANSLLATLNTRQVVRGRGTDTEHNTVPTFLMVTKNNRNLTDEERPQVTQGSALEVGVETHVTVTRDIKPEYTMTW